MAEGDENRLDHGSILSDIAASEAALDVQIEQGLQELEAQFYAMKTKEHEIAVKLEEEEKWNELIEAKNLEFDAIVKQRDDIQKNIAYHQCSIENSQKLLEFYEKERIEKQKIRESIEERYKKLIEYQKEKMNSYPLVIERNKLKTELLAASVELGTLEYREAEKKRRRKQMEEIQRIRRRNAMVKCAETYMTVKKLEEELKSREFEKSKTTLSTRLLETRDEMDSTDTIPTESAGLVFEDVISANVVEATALDLLTNDSPAVSEQPLQHIPDVENGEIDGVLKNFREKCQIDVYPSQGSLPTILSMETRANNRPKSNDEKPAGCDNPNETQNSVNSSENSRIDEECNQNGDESLLSEQGGSSKNLSETNDEMLHEAPNMRLRSALISTKLKKISSTNSDRFQLRPSSSSSLKSSGMVAEEEVARSFTEKPNATRKRVVFKSPPRPVKHMKTEKVVTSRNSPVDNHDDLPFRPVHPIERSTASYEQQVEHSRNYFNEKSSLQKISKAMTATDGMKCTSPNDTEPRTVTQESDFVPSVYFNETAVKKKNPAPPALDQRYEYDEYEETEEFYPENDEVNFNEGAYVARNDEDSYANQEISPGEEYLATEEDYVSGNEENIADDCPGQFEMTMENEAAQYDNYSDRNSEIDAEKEYADMQFEMPVDQNIQFDEEPGTMHSDPNFGQNMFDLRSDNSGDSIAFNFAQSGDGDGSADSKSFVFNMLDNKDLDCNPFSFSKSSSPKEFSFF